MSASLIAALFSASLALLATILRRHVIQQMESLGAQILVTGTDAIRAFRRTHAFAILFNVAQLVLIVWSLTFFSPQ
jgi:hypothetical protein